jgi:uncharacterized damage-inducible protein DinB
MTAHPVSEFLDHLDRIHERTRRIVVLIPPDETEWAPKPGWFTFGGLVRHIAGIERWMYAETVHGRPVRYPGHGRELADGRDAIVAYYDRLHAEARASFASLTDARMMEKCVTPAGAPISVWKWLRAHVEHEVHHRGQLYLMLSMRGIETPPIYGLKAEQLQALSASGSSPN